MEEFLNEILKDDGGKGRETVLRDYVLSGYKIKNCPVRTCKYGGPGFTIPGNVMYRICEIIDEMRKTGLTETEYYE